MARNVITDEAKSPKYNPYGRVEIRLLDTGGERVHVKCQDPFDEYLVKAVRDMQDRPEFTNPNRQEIVEFKGSCLGTPQFIEDATEYVGYLKRSGKAPKAVAFVIDDNVEGARLMRGVYLKMYETHDIDVNILKTVESSMEWLGALGRAP